MDDFAQLFDSLSGAVRALGVELKSIWFPIQIGLLLFAAAIAYWGSAWIKRHLQISSAISTWPPIIQQLVLTTYNILPFIVFAVAAGFLQALLTAASPNARVRIVHIAVSLTTAWVVISLLAALLRNHFVNRIVAVTAWTVAALSILGLLGDMTTMLDRQVFSIGDLKISLLAVLKTAILLVVGLWLAVAAGNFLDRRIQHATDLTPSIQILLGKLVRIALVALALAIVLNTAGINLSALAWFSGAVGVGVGFGLQKVVSNLVSGIILLADKSIKPGDVISTGDDIGWVSEINARYTLVSMRDGREVLVPNEDLVTQRVINWSHSNDDVRLEIAFGVSYDSDPHKVRKVALDTVGGIPRVLTSPGPSCHLVNFGDYSLDFVVRFWISDPLKGISRLTSDVRLALWDAFKHEGIEIPFPVRDVRITDGARARIERSDGKSATAA